jgi:y4mF family transcriptional regulator
MISILLYSHAILPIGKITIMDAKEFGKAIRHTRKAQGLTQQQLAMTANTAPRFISDLENGKPTCQIGKSLHVAHCLGIQVELNRSQSN